MTAPYRYRVRCVTEGAYVYSWASAPPTECPNDAGHTINSAFTSIVDQTSPRALEVKEDGIGISNTPHDSLDFVGNVLVTDQGSGVAEVSIGGALSDSTETYAFIIDYNTPYQKFNGSAWEVGAAIRFPGTGVYTPTAIKAVCGVGDPTKYFDLRIYDLTNSNVICTKLNIQHATKGIFDLGTLSNLPASEAVFEIQGRKAAVDGADGFLYSLHLLS